MNGNFGYLALDDILFIHSLAIEDQGGESGIRDPGLLESALAQPRQSFGGALIHGTLEEVAAAYLFFICKNHPFLDGNKRAGFGAMIGFLAINGFVVNATKEDSVRLVLGVAGGDMDRDMIVAWLRPRIQQRKSDSP